MTAEDPLIEFSIVLLSSECPHLDTSAVLAVRSWITLFLEGNLPYSEFHARVQAQCGSTAIVDRLQEIVTVSPDPLPEPRNLAASQFEPKSSRNKTRPWMAEEDNRLLAGVRKFGLGPGSTWSAIAKFVGNGRSRSQCSQRWIRVLDPRISKAAWAPQEDKTLLALVALHGEKSWMRIATELLNRSDVQCRYRYAQLQKESPGLQRLDPIALPSVKQEEWRVQLSGLSETLSTSPEMPIELEGYDPLFDSNIWLWRGE
jgi:hypothetical protein